MKVLTFLAEIVTASGIFALAVLLLMVGADANAARLCAPPAAYCEVPGIYMAEIVDDRKLTLRLGYPALADASLDNLNIRIQFSDYVVDGFDDTSACKYHVGDKTNELIAICDISDYEYDLSVNACYTVRLMYDSRALPIPQTRYVTDSAVESARMPSRSFRQPRGRTRDQYNTPGNLTHFQTDHASVCYFR